ncbi:MAG: DUF429 domain-containing protein [Opitutales bacterium]
MRWGLDGARGGWVLARLDPDCSSGAQVFFCVSLAEVEQRTLDDALHVDMPIGLATASSPQRDWDLRARQLLKGRLTSRVFTPPIREVVGCGTYAEANALSKKLIGKGLSVQAWNIVPKIRELDAFLEANTRLRTLWHEAHPEIAFSLLNEGKPILESKKLAEGLQIRKGLLRRSFAVCFDEVWDGLSLDRAGGRFGKDDILDALALSAADSAFT